MASPSFNRGYRLVDKGLRTPYSVCDSRPDPGFSTGGNSRYRRGTPVQQPFSWLREIYFQAFVSVNFEG